MRKSMIWGGIFTLVAVVLALPYIYFTVVYSTSGNIIEGNGQVPWGKLYFEGVKLALVVFSSCLIGFSWSKSLGLAGFGRVEDLKRNWQWILVYGGFIGLMIYIFGDRYFIKLAPGFYPTQLKFAIFIPIYAALVEETFARFGVMTFLVKIFGSKQIANILAALIFAIGHVNMFKVTGIIYRLNYVTFCSFILNLCVSLFFGYVYWRKGLLTAMGIHFVANLRYVLFALLR
ncbi:hypothetical protein BBF96_00945 [Anoxybacter fermentans]|uniref:CAAX prenyl protease 2/Lysostaphin resistance protein A-like domain-containing protein n=1 Tax=Anoxybacter fermentans TaxID=1323375 RepID=A0A3S9SUW0_9FIRM|nr:CPBP family intramembrane glutamic endopeptidase [Anoxybacter fermentans]AZR72081.1 hypothetical protein BBF96_00945 [Anoxybacter fermentans]